MQLQAKNWKLLSTVTLLVAGPLVLRTTQLNRTGYSPDEEITYFAVQGIRTHGLPVLPSGVLYERGLPYSYTAWLTGAALGHTITAYRLPSVVFGVATVWLVFLIALHLGGRATAFLAAALTAVSPILIAHSQWARFYSMFVTCYLGTFVLLYYRLRHNRLRGAYLPALGVTTLLHELGASLVVVPVFVWAASRSGGPLARRARALATQSLLTVAAVQIILLVVYVASDAAATVGTHRLADGAQRFVFPSIPVLRHASFATLALLVAILGAMSHLVRRRFHVGRVYTYVCLACSALFQMGALFVATLWGILIHRRAAGHILLYSLAMGFTAVILWTLHTGLMTDARPSPRVAVSLFQYSRSFRSRRFAGLPTRGLLPPCALSSSVDWPWGDVP